MFDPSTLTETDIDEVIDSVPAPAGMHTAPSAYPVYEPSPTRPRKMKRNLTGNQPRIRMRAVREGQDV